MNILHWLFAAKKYVVAHKFISVLLVLVVLGGGWWAYSVFATSGNEVRYVTATVATSTVISTLSESGTISATSDINISSEASGAILAIYIKPGTHVYAGSVIAKVDPTDALQAYNDAELSYETAQLTYENSIEPSTSLDLLKANNAVTNAQTALDKAHDSAFSQIASIYTDLSSIINGLDSVLYDSSVVRPNQDNISAYSDIVYNHDSSISIFKNSAATSYDAAVTAYNSALVKYKLTSRSVSNDDLIVLAQTTYEATKTVADAVKNSHDFFDRVNTDYSLYNNLGSSSNPSSLISSVNGYTTAVNSDLSNALSTKTNIVSAEQTLAEAQDALTTAKEGPDTLTMKSANLTLKKAQEALATAQKALDDCSVRAPFSGTVASIAVDQYQTVSNGTTIATIVSDNEVATLSVSEADAINIKVGQKATLTFDALPNVTIAGTVDSVSAAGSVSSGVVSYTVNVSLDTKNEEVKPGMSVTADIITGTATGIAVSTSAIKTSGSTSYVLVFDPPIETDSSSTSGTVSKQTPTKVAVTTGLAGDTETVIKSGLVGGEQVVTKTSTVSSSASLSSSNSSKSSASSLRGITGGPGGPGL